MRFVKQKKNITVRDIEPDKQRQRHGRRHGDLLPESMRCLIVGSSNCGKTNVAVCLLLDENGLVFQNVYLYTKTPHQGKYLYLRKIFKSIKGLGFYVYSDAADIVKPHETKPYSVIIFDDIACDKQDVMRMFFSMGRHSKVDSIYICQSYSRIPKQLIRDNANFIIMFKQDDLNLKHVYDDHVNTDMSLAQFKEICSVCWKDRYGFIVIDKDSDMNDGRYRNGFSTYIKV